MQEQKKLVCLCNVHFLLARLARQEQSHSELTRHQLTNPFHFEAVALPPPPSPRPTSPYRDDSGTKMRTRDARCSIPLARSALLHHMHPAVASLDKLGRAQPVQCLRSPQLLISAIVAWSIIVLFDANFVLSRAMCHDTSIALVPALRRFSTKVQGVHLTEVQSRQPRHPAIASCPTGRTRHRNQCHQRLSVPPHFFLGDLVASRKKSTRATWSPLQSGCHSA